MLKKGVTLRGLEVFDALAATGSVATASERTGLSQPAVSQQIRNLETALGVDLLDHARRPMRLTPAGRAFLGRVETVLGELRLAQSELTVMNLGDLETLSIGLIDDFDNDLTPRLVTILAESLSGSRFKLITAASHEINAAMRAGDLHVAIAASTDETFDTIDEYPLVRDPFILVTPRNVMAQGTNALDVLHGLPFLRYAQEQMIGTQIEQHLQSEGLDFAKRFEVGSHLALMAMVARQIGWAITTPLGYVRAARFHAEITAHPLPFAGFARTISLFAGSDWSNQVPRDISDTMQRLVQTHMIDPACAQLPWLSGELRLITD